MVHRRRLSTTRTDNIAQKDNVHRFLARASYGRTRRLAQNGVSSTQAKRTRILTGHRWEPTSTDDRHRLESVILLPVLAIEISKRPEVGNPTNRRRRCDDGRSKCYIGDRGEVGETSGGRGLVEFWAVGRPWISLQRRWSRIQLERGR